MSSKSTAAPSNWEKAKKTATPAAVSTPATPSLTEHAGYRETLERDHKLAVELGEVNRQRQELLDQMKAFPGLEVMKPEDIEPMKLAGLHNPEMKKRVDLSEQLRAVDQKRLNLERARELLLPHLDQMKIEAKRTLDARAFAVYKPSVRAAAEKFVAAFRAMLDLKRLREQLGQAELLGGSCHSLPLPLDNTIFRSGVGMGGGGIESIIKALVAGQFITEEEAADYRAMFPGMC
jgi:hypothetical protein